MCWRRIFGKPEISPDEEFLNATHKALLFGVNNYPGGSANDLAGCLNDIKDFEAKLKQYWPQFKIRKFQDSEVTINRFLTEIRQAVDSLKPGSVVTVFSDSCFSESNTKNNNFCVKRYFAPEKRRKIKVVRKVFCSDKLMKWLAFSACQDDQTASDAYFNGRANGAFTYYNLQSMIPGITYRELFERINVWLPSKTFAQIPAFEGPENLKDKKLFEDPTLIIAYSGHGSYLPDDNGDEPDGVDETLYVYDGHVRDDKIREILFNIP